MAAQPQVYARPKFGRRGWVQIGELWVGFPPHLPLPARLGTIIDRPSLTHRLTRRLLPRFSLGIVGNRGFGLPGLALALFIVHHRAWISGFESKGSRPGGQLPRLTFRRDA